MRIVHYLGAQKFGDLNRPAYREGREEFWDFDLSFKPEELVPDHYGRWGAIPEVLLHEMGHVLSPDGAVGIDSAGVPPLQLAPAHRRVPVQAPSRWTASWAAGSPADRRRPYG